jgi:hypothetical protein
MQLSRQIGLIGLGAVLALVQVPASSLAQSFPQAVRLQTRFTGSNKCLDIVNDGSNNQPIMSKCGNYSGQLWRIQPSAREGFYRLQNQFSGSDKCLDIVNDGSNNQLIMGDCGNYSGQLWRIQPSAREGFYRLQNQFSGSDK